MCVPNRKRTHNYYVAYTLQHTCIYHTVYLSYLQVRDWCTVYSPRYTSQVCIPTPVYCVYLPGRVYHLLYTIPRIYRLPIVHVGHRLSTVYTPGVYHLLYE